MLAKGSRPKNLNLFRFRFPIGAIASILHRISGAYLFLCIPVMLYIFDISLRGPHGFTYAQNWFHSGWGWLISVVGLWCALHHFLAGVRVLLIDFDLGVDIVTARKTARGVVYAAPILALLLGVWWL